MTRSPSTLSRTLATLLEISTEMSSILDLDELLNRVSQLLGRIIDHELFALLLVDEDTCQFVWECGVGYSNMARQKFHRLNLDQGICGRAFQEKRPILVPDVSVDPDYVVVETLSGKKPVATLAAPLIFRDRVLGVIVLESTTHNAFRKREVRLINALARQMAVAISNAQLYAARDRDARIKKLLNEVGKEISSILKLDPLLAKVATLTGKLIDYKVFYIGLLSADREAIELKLAMGVDSETRKRLARIPIGRGVISTAVRERRPVVVQDLREHPTRISMVTDTGEETRSMIAVPLISKREVLGVLAMQSTQVGFFKNEDVLTVTTLGNQIAVALENARLFQEIYRREQRLKHDVQVARSMQYSMLPKQMPEVPGFDFATKYIPAGELAGDLYDYLYLAEGRIGFVIGDVSGKGLSAAMVMAASRSALRFAARGNSDPAQVLATTNRQLFRDIKNRVYVAMFYGILDFEERSFVWTNAGHHPPLRVGADDTVTHLSSGGTVLGLFDNGRYSKEETRIEPGDIYVFYTDGVIEAQDPAGREFGESRLVDLVIGHRSLTARGIRDKILRGLRDHCSGVTPHDDITLVIMKCS